MARFEEIEKIIGDNDLPCTAQNEDGETVIIECGKDDAGKYFRLTTLQHNDWCRINTYYEDGTITETYKK